jgi:hypothetical protein
MLVQRLGPAGALACGLRDRADGHGGTVALHSLPEIHGMACCAMAALILAATTPCRHAEDACRLAVDSVNRWIDNIDALRVSMPRALIAHPAAACNHPSWSGGEPYAHGV